MPHYELALNGERVAVEADEDTPLLYVLRGACGLRGPKFGCGLGQCGACTVLLDGDAVRSCVLPVSAIGALKVVTLEGLGNPRQPHPLQQAFIDEQAVQCGYCINGMVMTAAAPRPTEAQVCAALENNLCRCGTHTRIVKAVLRAGSGRPAGVRPSRTTTDATVA
ncbi:(2Fe-2S)-binding protein [Piscinibacter sakaiensis]|uniref:(2Fe-2S)-binding protein n=1 Tax=Piscinibacter sakaiensis TaxID=1547922 RepID=UPI00372BE105